MRLLKVVTCVGDEHTFGVPDDYEPPEMGGGEEWLKLPRAPGSSASVVFRLRDVRYLSAYDEVVQYVDRPRPYIMRGYTFDWPAADECAPLTPKESVTVLVDSLHKATYGPGPGLSVRDHDRAKAALNDLAHAAGIS